MTSTEYAPRRLLEETRGNARNLDTTLITFVTRVRCVDIVAWNRDVLMLWLVHRFQKGNEVLVVRQFFCHREGNDIPVQLSISFCQCPEKWRNWFMQLLDSALGCWRCVTVIARIAHTCKGMKREVTRNSLNSSPWNRREYLENQNCFFFAKQNRKSPFIYIPLLAQ